MQIKKLPLTERPYEKLELYGEKMLTNAELLAIIIKSGTKEETSVQLAQRILQEGQNSKDKSNLNFLREMSIQELMNFKGIGKVKAIQLKAICEIAIRMNTPTNYQKIKIRTPDDVANIFLRELQYAKREVAKVVLLNSKNIVIKIVDVSLGGSNFAKIQIKDVVNPAVKMQAPKMILVHNHPSGDSTPSKMDIEMTKRIYEATDLLDIELLDHVVIGNMQYTSIFSQEASKT